MICNSRSNGLILLTLAVLYTVTELRYSCCGLITAIQNRQAHGSSARLVPISRNFLAKVLLQLELGSKWSSTGKISMTTALSCDITQISLTSF
ncbi:hypothetical protein M758_4G266100 [Ceratodon purpureus]|nr:hypothetical protein M758_4G266100 [Ceratodon purpureus]